MYQPKRLMLRPEDVKTQKACNNINTDVMKVKYDLD